MTAEIVIMNKRGVAASADSAATVGNKTFNGANKLFQLIKNKPVGVLVFNNSEVNGIPVDLIIKEYGSTRQNKKLDSLKDYVEDFKTFLKKFVKQHMGAWDPLLGAFDDFLIVSNRLTELNLLRETLLTNRNIINIRHTKDLKTKIKKYLELRKAYLPQTADFSNLNIDEIVDVFLLFVNRCDFSPAMTGFAIFGYGDKDIYPKTYVFHSVGFINDKVFKFFSEEAHETDQDIIQLAQRDMSDMFIFGLPYHLKRSITKIYNDVIAKLFISIGGNTPEVKSIVENALANCAKEVDKNITGNRLNNLQQSLPHLPLEDLSNLSATLIRLECLKNRASLDMESVGGEVKTAIISKHEGFRWKNDKK